jgi:deoxyadenosine/deoxycytidine kinase
MGEPIIQSNRNQSRVRIVEIVGPAGAGKTTVLRMLDRHVERVQLGRLPDVNKKGDAFFFVCHWAGLIPFLIRSCYRKGGRLNRRELAWLAILRGWPRRLQREKRKNEKVIVLDQGPIYLLAETKELGPKCLKGQRAERFWEKVYKRWGAMLDLVICLDAKNACLQERIQARTKGHVVKNEPWPKVFKFLDSYRAAYHHILKRLEADGGGPRIIKFDTSQEQPEDIAVRLSFELGLNNEHSW